MSKAVISEPIGTVRRIDYPEASRRSENIMVLGDTLKVPVDTETVEALARAMAFIDTNPDIQDDVWKMMSDGEERTGNISDLMSDHGKNWWRARAAMALFELGKRLSEVTP